MATAGMAAIVDARALAGNASVSSIAAGEKDMLHPSVLHDAARYAVAHVFPTYQY
jgi:hypothetical protein